MILIVSYLMCAFFARREVSYTPYDENNEIEGNPLEVDGIESTPILDNDLYAPVVVGSKSKFWNKLATRIYVAIALFSALVYITSRLPWAPPSPFWMLLVFQVYTFGGAFIVYQTWKTEKE